MANKKNKSNKQYKEDVLFFRMSVLFIAACIAIIGIFRLNGTHLALDFWRLSRNPAYIAVISVIFVASLIYALICKKNKKNESESTFSSLNLLSITSYVFFVSMYWGFSQKISAWAILFATISALLLYFINNVFKKDFFVFSLANVVFVAAIWLFSFEGIVYNILAALVLALSAYMCFIAYKNGKADDKKESLCVFPVYISFVIAAAIIVFRYFILLPFLTSSLVTAILIFQYLIFGIFYTIRLIREA